MEKTYNHKYIEKHWEKVWEEANYFAPSEKGDPYCIVIPPPNVTGTLHMGHGFQYAIMDILTRYHRMRGFNTLWQVGTDHAGIATQMVVVKKLIAEGKDPTKMPREQLVKTAWEWKDFSHDQICKQMRNLGISVDWTREKFTLDEDLSTVVRQVFIDLYNEGLIYRGKRLVNWDTVLNTAISDLEVITNEENGYLWYIQYPVEDSDDVIIVATTRPETILGDTAVAINPDDDRYHHLIGKYVRLPLTERRIPIISDEYVDKEFGTGCVKITPAHDFNDYQVAMRHDLPLINILNPDATLNDAVPERYRGLDRFKAREEIIDDLAHASFLKKIEPYKIKIPRGDRSGSVIEPLLTDQWFLNSGALAKPAIEAVEKGEIKFIPENWDKIYFQWLNNIQDWCISRQLWWGHRIPAWYDEYGHVYVGNDENEVRTKHKLGDKVLTQDPDVLDTWFSSALWPFTTLGWPEQTKEFKTFYPTSVLVTGFDIIFFWVARMVMMGIKLTGKIPFHEVYITGLIRDSEGQKMSKSKGNILDPTDLIDGIDLETLLKKRTANLMQPQLEKKIIANTKKEFPEGIKSYGADALRITFCALASTSRDINFSVNRLEGYRNFCNKIWNASRFVLMQPHDNCKPEVLTKIDIWIYSRLQRCVKSAIESIESYRFDLLAQAIYDFIWHEYCDWYLELAKVAPHSNTVMLDVLDQILRLVHPIAPFVTEEIWQHVRKITGNESNTIMLQPYPVLDETKISNEIEQEIEWLKSVITAIRNIRGEMDIPKSAKLELLLKKGTKLDHQLIDEYESALKALIGLESIKWLTTDAPSRAATAIVDDLEIYVPLEHLIDMAAEVERLNKDIVKLHKEIKVLKTKLETGDFSTRAPKEIVDKEKERLINCENALHKLQQRIKILE
jgi:valyl-tRNA synthetase